MACRDRPDVDVGRGGHERERLPVLVLMDACRRRVINVVPDDDRPITHRHVFEPREDVYRRVDLPDRRKVASCLLWIAAATFETSPAEISSPNSETQSDLSHESRHCFPSPIGASRSAFLFCVEDYRVFVCDVPVTATRRRSDIHWRFRSECGTGSAQVVSEWSARC